MTDVYSPAEGDRLIVTRELVRALYLAGIRHPFVFGDELVVLAVDSRFYGNQFLTDVTVKAAAPHISWRAQLPVNLARLCLKSVVGDYSSDDRFVGMAHHLTHEYWAQFLDRLTGKDYDEFVSTYRRGVWESWRYDPTIS